ncbi:MAG: DUF126 domain-containing protein [Acidilobaceae archaeon]
MKGRSVVPGRARGEAVVVESISFYGDVDPKSGTLQDGRSIAGKVLIARRSKGSTVGPYVMYALRRRGRAPLAVLLVSKSDPVLVSGAVLSETVLVDSLPEEVMAARDGEIVQVLEDGTVILEGGTARPSA